MILHPIIDLLKRIVVALPDYAGGGGGELPDGMSHTGSGEFMFASAELLTTQIIHGLSFTPKAILIWTDDTTGYGLGFGYLTRELIYNELTAKSFRSFVMRISTSSGYEINNASAASASAFITDTYFTFDHGSKRYIAGATYYWFAFD